MNGTTLESIVQLKKLHTVQLDWNPWTGAVYEIHFMGLIKLEHFSIYLFPAINNSLVFDTKSDWISADRYINDIGRYIGQIG